MCPPLIALAIPTALSALGAGGIAASLGLGSAAAAGTLAAGSSSFALGSAAGLANLSGAISAIGTITNFVGQSQAAAANKKAANQNFAAKTNALNTQNTQLSEQESEDHVSNAIKSAQQYGRISATAANLGMGTSTLSPFLSAAQGNVSRDQSIEDINTNSKRQNIQAEGVGAELERTSQINSKPPPSLLSGVLGLGKDALGAASLFGQVGGKFGVSDGSSS